MSDEKGLRERMTRQGEETIGKLAQELLENPVISGALSRGVRDPRARGAGPGSRDGGPQPALGERPRAADAATARRLAAARGDRGRARPGRAAGRGRRLGHARSTSAWPRSRSSSTRIEAALTRSEDDVVAPSATSAQAERPRRRPRRAGARRPGARRPRSAGGSAGSRRRRSAGSPPRPRAGRRGRTASRSPSRPRPRRRRARPARRPAAGRRTGRLRRRARPGASAPAASTEMREQLPGRPGPGSATPRARLVPSAAIAPVATSSSPSASDPSIAPQVPTRTMPARPELDQLGDDDRRARSAHAGALDREQPAVVGGAGVAPQAAVVVEHLRLVEQRLGKQQRATRVAGEQHPRGELGGRMEVDRPGHPGEVSRTSGPAGRAGPTAPLAAIAT